jgi:hypothetical protein
MRMGRPTNVADPSAASAAKLRIDDRSDVDDLPMIVAS